MVRGVEGLQSDVAVLAAGRVVVAVGGEGEGVDGAEVTLDAAELLLEDEVVETRVELADLGRGGCDLHGVLASTQNHLEENKKKLTFYILYRFFRDEKNRFGKP